MLNYKVLCEWANLWQSSFQEPYTPIICGFFVCCMLYITIFFFRKAKSKTICKLYEGFDTNYKKDINREQTIVGTYEYLDSHEFVYDVSHKKKRRFVILVDTAYCSKQDYQTTIDHLKVAYTRHELYKSKVPHLVGFYMVSSPSQLVNKVGWVKSAIVVERLPTRMSICGQRFMNVGDFNSPCVTKFFSGCLGSFEDYIQKEGYRDYQGNRVLLIIDVGEPYI